MRKFAIFMAVGALSISAHAAASPFSLTASSDSKGAEAETESRSLLDIAFNATANAFGFNQKAGGIKDDDFVLKYADKQQGCTAEDAVEEEAAVEEPEKKAPVGPEPIYFGF